LTQGVVSFNAHK